MAALAFGPKVISPENEPVECQVDANIVPFVIAPRRKPRAAYAEPDAAPIMPVAEAPAGVGERHLDGQFLSQIGHAPEDHAAHEEIKGL